MNLALYKYFSLFIYSFVYLFSLRQSRYVHEQIFGLALVNKFLPMENALFTTYLLELNVINIF